MPITARSLRLTPLILLSVAIGCAKSPAGGPLAPAAPDTLAVSMTTQQPPNPSFDYAWAFDDTGGVQTAAGPVAIIGASSTASNHIVGGTFDVLVTYESGVFAVYRRTNLGNGNDQLDQATRAFVTQPSVNGNVFNFTLSMDAVTNSGANLFQFPATSTKQALNVNFVTVNTILLTPNDNRERAFDAFYPGQSAEWCNFDVTSTRTYTNAETVNEPAGDVNPGDPSFALSSNDLSSLDITDFTISVARATT